MFLYAGNTGLAGIGIARKQKKIGGFMKDRKLQLKTGVTTGLCAAAAAKAATITLLSSEEVRQVSVTAKTGAEITFNVTDTLRFSEAAKCAVIKDSGDDPDITNGLKVFATVNKTGVKGITIDGGDGIGRVTKPGLKVAVGKAAINPVPMEMVNSAIMEVCDLFSYTGGIRAILSIPGGAAIAKKTMNKRLGIVGLKKKFTKKKK